MAINPPGHRQLLQLIRIGLRHASASAAKAGSPRGRLRVRLKAYSTQLQAIAKMHESAEAAEFLGRLVELHSGRSTIS